MKKAIDFLYEEIHRLVDISDNCWWDGYTVVFFEPSPNAYMKKNAVFSNGSWGVTNRVSPNRNGIWKVPAKQLEG